MSESSNQLVAQYFNLGGSDLTALETEVGAGRSLGDLVTLVIQHSAALGTLSTHPNIPLTSPTVQNVIDALVTLGLVTQSDI